MIFRDDLFKNKSVLVTGGGTGIGKEIAAQFLKAGATVFICGRKEAKLKEAIEELSLLGPCFEKTTDIRETAQILDLANFIKEISWLLENIRSFHICDTHTLPVSVIYKLGNSSIGINTLHEVCCL